MSNALLDGKVIVIIGGTTGLGLSAAQAVLAAGAKGVVVTGRNPASAEAAVAVLGKTRPPMLATPPHQTTPISPSSSPSPASALVETPMAQRAAGDETILSFIATKQPLDGGHIGKPSDLDAAAVYFLSDGSAFTTGQILAVDGGWTVSEGQIPDKP